jgi:hypothetical protein
MNLASRIKIKNAQLFSNKNAPYSVYGLFKTENVTIICIIYFFLFSNANTKLIKRENQERKTRASLESIRKMLNIS